MQRRELDPVALLRISCVAIALAPEDMGRESCQSGAEYTTPGKADLCKRCQFTFLVDSSVVQGEYDIP